MTLELTSQLLEALVSFLELQLECGALYFRSLETRPQLKELSFTSLEGFIVGTLFGKIGMAVKGELTREKFITTMQEVGRFDMGGLMLQYGPTDHQGLDDIYLTRIYPTVQKLEDGD